MSVYFHPPPCWTWCQHHIWVGRGRAPHVYCAGGTLRMTPHLPIGSPGIDGPLEMPQSGSRVLATGRTRTRAEGGWAWSGHGGGNRTPWKILGGVVVGCQCCCWVGSSCPWWGEPPHEQPPHASVECPTAAASEMGGRARGRDPRNHQWWKRLTFTCPRSASSSEEAVIGEDLHKPVSGLAFFSHGVAEVPLEY